VAGICSRDPGLNALLDALLDALFEALIVGAIEAGPRAASRAIDSDPTERQSKQQRQARAASVSCRQRIRNSRFFPPESRSRQALRPPLTAACFVGRARLKHVLELDSFSRAAPSVAERAFVFV
jgi:hypothetical protein